MSKNYLKPTLARNIVSRHMTLNYAIPTGRDFRSTCLVLAVIGFIFSYHLTSPLSYRLYRLFFLNYKWYHINPRLNQPTNSQMCKAEFLTIDRILRAADYTDVVSGCIS